MSKAAKSLERVARGPPRSVAPDVIDEDDISLDIPQCLPLSALSPCIRRLDSGRNAQLGFFRATRVCLGRQFASQPAAANRLDEA